MRHLITRLFRADSTNPAHPKPRAAAAAAVVGLLLATGLAAPAQAAEAPSEDDFATPALYGGTMVDLDEFEELPFVCMEDVVGPVECYDSVPELAEATGLDVSVQHTCADGWFCLYEGYNRTGSYMMTRSKGTTDLYNKRDKGSSLYNNRPNGGYLIDQRTLMPDPQMLFPARSWINDLRNVSYVHGGTWNNRADKVYLY